MGLLLCLLLLTTGKDQRKKGKVCLGSQCEVQCVVVGERMLTEVIESWLVTLHLSQEAEGGGLVLAHFPFFFPLCLVWDPSSWNGSPTPRVGSSP